MWKILRLFYLLLAIALLPAQASVLTAPQPVSAACNSHARQPHDCSHDQHNSSQPLTTHAVCCQVQPGDLPVMPQALQLPGVEPRPAPRSIHFESHIQPLPEHPPQA